MEGAAFVCKLSKVKEALVAPGSTVGASLCLGVPPFWSNAGRSPVGASQLVLAGSGAWDQWGWGGGLVPPPPVPGCMVLRSPPLLGCGSPRPSKAPDQAGRKQD